MSTWTIDSYDNGYQWHVTVGNDTADGLTRTEPDALREVAWALDWLQGGVCNDRFTRSDPAGQHFPSPR